MTLTSRAFSAVQVRAVEERQGLRLPRKLWGVASQPLCTKPSLPAVVPAAATTDAAVLCQLLCRLQLQLVLRSLPAAVPAAAAALRCKTHRRNDRWQRQRDELVARERFDHAASTGHQHRNCPLHRRGGGRDPLTTLHLCTVVYSWCNVVNGRFFNLLEAAPGSFHSHVLKTNLLRLWVRVQLGQRERC